MIDRRGTDDAAFRSNYGCEVAVFHPYLERAVSGKPRPPNAGRGAQTLCLESRGSRKRAVARGKGSRAKCPASYLMWWAKTLERETGLEPATLCLGRLGSIIRSSGLFLNLASYYLQI